MKALSNVFIIGVLDLQQETSKILVSLDDLIEGLVEGLHLSVFIVRCLFQSVCKQLLQIDSVSCEEALVLNFLLRVLRVANAVRPDLAQDICCLTSAICRAGRECQNLLGN